MALLRLSGKFQVSVDQAERAAQKLTPTLCELYPVLEGGQVDNVVAALRRHAKEVRELPEGAEEFCVHPDLLDDAANEIERLRAAMQTAIDDRYSHDVFQALHKAIYPPDSAGESSDGSADD